MKRQLFLLLFFSAVALQLYSQKEIVPVDTSKLKSSEVMSLSPSSSGLPQIIPPSPEVEN